jgi:thiamine-monophosphate kinase
MTDINWRDLTMGDLGEKGFLRQLLPTLDRHPSFVNGFGDDASAIRISDNQLLLFKIDRAAAPMAAKRGWTDYRMWGRLAVTSNCSDILTGGGTPIAVMTAMILPRDWKAQAAFDAVQGCAQECLANKIAFAGGDTKEGISPEMIGSAVGLCQKDQLLTRRGARVGDLIVVAGKLGGFLGSYLQIIESLETGSGCENVQSWQKYVAHPTARWSEAKAMRESRIATAAMDTSDGLYDAVSTLTANRGADLHLDSLPYHDIAYECSKRLGISPFNLALGVGDWNIVYTVSPKGWDDFTTRSNSSLFELRVIGEVTEAEGIRWRDRSGAVFQCAPVVNEHFAARLEDESTLLDRLRTQTMLSLI